jgi:Mg-chelatase subunit ChlD
VTLLSVALLTVRSPAASVAHVGLKDEVRPEPTQDVPSDVPGLVARLRSQRDDADPELVRKLAGFRTREALDGLIATYAAMDSTYMKRLILQQLVAFDRVTDCDQAANQFLMDAATQSGVRELRLAAVDCLAGCEVLGKNFLALVVDSATDDEVRVRAMEHHSGDPRAADKSWYLRVYQLRNEQPGDDSSKERKRKKKDEDEPTPPRIPHQLPRLRALAFEALAGGLTVDEVVSALTDPVREIRRRALQELDARGDERALTHAEAVYASIGSPPEDRVFCAQILARARGADFAERLIEDASRADAPLEFQLGAGEIVDEFASSEVDKKLLSGANRARGLAQLFFMRGLRHASSDEKVEKLFLKLLRDKETQVQIEAMHALAAAGSKAALPEIEKVFKKSKDPALVVAALEALHGIRGKEAGWLAELQGYVAEPEEIVRNAALEILGSTGRREVLPLLIEALSNPFWTTRLAACRGLERLRLSQGVGALCGRIGLEEGRMREEFATSLWRLSGMPFHTNAAQWERWWASEGSTFQPIDEAELKKRAKEEELRKLKDLTASTFFGIRIVSHRVVFILDISGSMEEATRGSYIGEQGEHRIVVAKKELLRALDGLEKDTLFNVIAFSGDVESWSDAIRERTDETLESAKEYVREIPIGGGTNIYGALQSAFADPQVDTIYFLSDGEPSVGDVIDPEAIRTEVADWNKHRRLVIHSIAVGGSLRLLEQLAADTGGTYVHYP